MNIRRMFPGVPSARLPEAALGVSAPSLWPQSGRVNSLLPGEEPQRQKSCSWAVTRLLEEGPLGLLGGEIHSRLPGPLTTGGWPCGASSVIDWETEAQGRTCLARSFMETVGDRPLGIQSGLGAVPLLSVGSASGMGSPSDLSLTPASAAPGKRRGHLRTGTKGPPAPEHWGLLPQTVSLNQQTALGSQVLLPQPGQLRGSFPGISTQRATCSQNEKALSRWLPPIFHSLVLKKGVNTQR